MQVKLFQWFLACFIKKWSIVRCHCNSSFHGHVWQVQRKYDFYCRTVAKKLFAFSRIIICIIMYYNILNECFSLLPAGKYRPFRREVVWGLQCSAPIYRTAQVCLPGNYSLKTFNLTTLVPMSNFMLMLRSPYLCNSH